MRYHSVRKKATATVGAIILLLLIIVCGGASALGWGKAEFWQMMMLAFAWMFILVVQRYLSASYEYILDPLEDILSYNRLTVIRIMGKRRRSVLVQPLGELVRVIPYCKTKALVTEYGRPIKRLNLCPDVFPEESYLLLFEINGELMTVRLQCDAPFAKALRERAGV